MQVPFPHRARSPQQTPLGIRAVALFEALKGVTVLLAGFGVLVAFDHGAATTLDALVGHLHLNPAKGAPRIFVEWLDDVSNRDLQWLAAGAAVYASLRLAEAVGLWRGRAWAEWLAVASGAIYLPLELYELAHGVTALRIATLLANLGIVAYMGLALWRDRRAAGAR